MVLPWRHYGVIIQYDDVINRHSWRHEFYKKGKWRNRAIYIPSDIEKSGVRIESLDILRFLRAVTARQCPDIILEFNGFVWFEENEIQFKKGFWSLWMRKKKEWIDLIDHGPDHSGTAVRATMSLTNLTVFFRFIIITFALRDPPIVIIPDRVTTSTLILKFNY